MTPAHYKAVDVLGIGAGNAALAAHVQGASVAMLALAPESARGGNSAFTGGAFRFVYDGIDDLLALATLKTFNEAPRPDVKFNPNVHDGLRTIGIPFPKTNWAQKLDTPPYHACGVTAGVTFTFGGLKVTTSAEVEDTNGMKIDDIFAAGEIVGGLYYHNYGSGTGLVAAAAAWTQR